MNDRIICPKCDHAFEMKGHLKDKVNGFSTFFRLLSSRRSLPLFSNRNGSDLLSSQNCVICPSCGSEIVAEDYKYFGFLGQKALKFLIYIFIVLFIAFPIFILIRDQFM